MKTLSSIVGVILFLSILSARVARAQDQVITVPLYRVYNRTGGWHLYTTREDESGRLVSQGWESEGIAGWVFPQSIPQTTPLYRRYHQKDGDHLYTISKDEADRAIYEYGYVDEGIAGYVAAEELKGTQPFRRFNNPKFGHLYTTDVNDAARAVQQAGYVEEGIVGYIWTASTSLPVREAISTPPPKPDPKSDPKSPDPKSTDSPNWTVIIGSIATLLTAIAGVITAVKWWGSKT